MIQYILRLMSNKKILTSWQFTMNSWKSIFTFAFATVGSAFVVFTALQVTIAFCEQKLISDYHNLGLLHLFYSTLLNNCTVGYFLINIFCVGIHFFIIHVYKSQAGTVGAYLKTFKYVHMLIWIGTLIRKCRVGGFSCLLNHVSQLKLTQ